MMPTVRLKLVCEPSLLDEVLRTALQDVPGIVLAKDDESADIVVTTRSAASLGSEEVGQGCSGPRAIILDSAANLIRIQDHESHHTELVDGNVRRLLEAICRMRDDPTHN